MEVSLEHLYHYQCDKCNRWWSIADIISTVITSAKKKVQAKKVSKVRTKKN